MDDAYKVLFVAEAGADVVLVSSDDAVFPVRRVSLQANSDVFDDMFRSSTGATDEKDQETGLPRVKIDEKAEDIDFLLRLFVIRQIKTSTQYMSFARAESVYRMADKYCFEDLEKLALARLHVLAERQPLSVLDYGLRTRHLELTKAALSNLAGAFDTHRTVANFIGVTTTGTLHRIAGLPLETLETLPLKTVQSLFAYETRVILDLCRWSAFANTFVRLLSQPHALPPPDRRLALTQSLDHLITDV